MKKELQKEERLFERRHFPSPPEVGQFRLAWAEARGGGPSAHNALPPHTRFNSP